MDLDFSHICLVDMMKMLRNGFFFFFFFVEKKNERVKKIILINLLPYPYLIKKLTIS